MCEYCISTIPNLMVMCGHDSVMGLPFLKVGRAMNTQTASSECRRITVGMGCRGTCTCAVHLIDTVASEVVSAQGVTSLIRGADSVCKMPDM